MKVHVLKEIRVDKLGVLRPGWVGELHPSVAKLYVQQSAVEPYQTKVIRETPLPAVGTPLFVSPAAQVLPLQTSTPSEVGGKTPKKKKSAALS